MINYIADREGIIVAEMENDPVCGEDFCDDCGECLVCYADDPCFHSPDKKHRWVNYMPCGIIELQGQINGLHKIMPAVGKNIE